MLNERFQIFPRFSRMGSAALAKPNARDTFRMSHRHESQAWAELKTALRRKEGGNSKGAFPSTAQGGGLEYWDWLGERPEEERLFQNLMGVLSEPFTADIGPPRLKMP